ncbi:response regulator [Streptomyces sp. NPDC050658]|uniref:response regulator transcription factor n=1 Tax=unclassified Streptomyces TaxID=2593676 RepID=UPI0034456B7F
MIVDDDVSVRTGLQRILETSDDIGVLATCGGADAEALAHLHRPDVALVDIHMPDVDGLAVLKALLALPEPPAVSMLTSFGADTYVSAALGAGALGFLLKDTTPDQLISGVRLLATGGSALSPRVARAMSRDDTGPDRAQDGRAGLRARVAELTHREREVLTQLAEGHSNNEIARRLALSRSTAKDYVSAIYAKLRTTNRVQAATLAHRASLNCIDTDPR